MKRPIFLRHNETYGARRADKYRTKKEALPKAKVSVKDRIAAAGGKWAVSGIRSWSRYASIILPSFSCSVSCISHDFQFITRFIKK